MSGRRGALVLSVLLLAGPDGPLIVRASAGADAAEAGTRVHDLGSSIAGRSLAERRPVLVRGDGVEIGLEWRRYRKSIPSAICLPIVAVDGEALGVLALKSTVEARALDPDDLDMRDPRELSDGTAAQTGCHPSCV